MIRVTRLDRREIALNCDLVESIEAKPDTTIRLITGQSLVVRENLDQVLERIQLWRAGVLARAGLASSDALGGPVPLALRATAAEPLEIVDDEAAAALTEVSA